MIAQPKPDAQPWPTRKELAQAAFALVARWPTHDYQRLALILITALFENIPSSLERDWYTWLLSERSHVPDTERPILHLRPHGEHKT